MTPNPGFLCRDCPHNNHQKSSTDSHREAVCGCDRKESVTYLRIDPTTFASDAAAGFVAAHGSLVRSVAWWGRWGGELCVQRRLNPARLLLLLAEGRVTIRHLLDWWGRVLHTARHWVRCLPHPVRSGCSLSHGPSRPMRVFFCATETMRVTSSTLTMHSGGSLPTASRAGPCGSQMMFPVHRPPSVSAAAESPVAWPCSGQQLGQLNRDIHWKR